MERQKGMTVGVTIPNWPCLGAETNKKSRFQAPLAFNQRKWSLLNRSFSDKKKTSKVVFYLPSGYLT